MAVTLEAVAAAADDLFKRTGKRPTIRALRKAVGGGSFTVLIAHLRQWDQARGVTPGPGAMPETARQALELAVPKIWESALDAAGAHHEEEKQVLRSLVAAAADREDELQTVIAELETERQQVRQQLDQAVLENSRLDGEITNLASAHKSVSDTNGQLSEQIRSFHERAIALEHARTDMQQRLDSEHANRLETERLIELLRGDLRVLTTERDAAMADGASVRDRLQECIRRLHLGEQALEAEQSAGAARVNHAQMEIQRAKDDLAAASQQLVVLRATASQVESDLSASKARVAHLENSAEAARAGELAALAREQAALTREQGLAAQNRHLVDQVQALTSLLDTRIDALSRAVSPPPVPPGDPA